MFLVNQVVKKIEQPTSYFSGDLSEFRIDALKFLEDIGRTCYKSTSSTTSWETFIPNIVSSGHDSVIEHLYFAVEFDPFECELSGLKYIVEDWNYKNPIIVFNARGLKTSFYEDNRYDVRALTKYISGIVPELFSEEDKKEIGRLNITDSAIQGCGFKLVKYNGVEAFETYRIITDIGVRNELVRHRRDCSYSVESSRYCNYSKDKFNNQLTFITPDLLLNLNDDKDIEIFEVWCESMKSSEYYYNKLKALGAKNDLARGVLPQALKSELVFTCSQSQLYDHIMPLREDKAAHPLMRNLMKLIKESNPDMFHEEGKL